MQEGKGKKNKKLTPKNARQALKKHFETVSQADFDKNMLDLISSGKIEVTLNRTQMKEAMSNLNIKANFIALVEEFERCRGIKPGPHDRKILKAQAMNMALQSVDIENSEDAPDRDSHEN